MELENAAQMLAQQQFLSVRLAGSITCSCTLWLRELAVPFHLLLRIPSSLYKPRCLWVFLAPGNSDPFLNGTHVP